MLPLAAPGLVELVERGQAQSPEAEAALRATLAEIIEYAPDTLILGCTHYPLLRPLIQKVTEGKMTIVDSAHTTAARVARVLAANGLAAANEPARHQIYVTGSPDQFLQTAHILFENALPPIQTVSLELVEQMGSREAVG